MNKLTSALTAFGLSGLVAGCVSHTVVGNGGGDGATSPDGRLRLAIEVHGANGKPYVAETKKRVYIWILPNRTNNPAPVLRTNHTFVGAGLKWHIGWLATNQVSVELVDYGPGVSSYDRYLTVANRIGRLTFAEHDGVFYEEHK